MVRWQHVGTVICLLSFLVLFLHRNFPQRSGLDAECVHPLKTAAVIQNDTKHVLVTGIAGFIGFHLAKALAGRRNTVVVGLDDFNDYYDVQLKKNRAFILHKLGVTVYHEDLCHTEFLEDIFTRYNFTHVTHLAAQAGVRYSLENPLAYVRANVECQLALLDVLRKYPNIKLIYASSSSVYGKHTPIPFRLTSHTDRPGNMYAATKETDELLAHYYCHAYKLRAIGLRFFTVYGPWGRPDMATYKFADAMARGREVPMFHVSDDEPLERDFTYIDDIIRGITMALDYKASKCGEKFNLGFGRPVSVPAMINILKTELNVKAKIKKMPLPPTEILKTWADISVSRELLHFRPTTDLQEGVKKFVEWFNEYSNKSKSTDKEMEAWFDRILEERDVREVHYEKRKIPKHNKDLPTQLEHNRQTHTDGPQTAGKHIPTLCREKFTVHKHSDRFNESCQCEKGYKKEGRNCVAIYGEVSVADGNFLNISAIKKGHDMVYFQGLTAGGDNYVYVPMSMRHNKNQLKEICRNDSFCVAVTTDGWIKRTLVTREHWTKVDNDIGIYVFDIDYCSLGENKCPAHSRCTRVGRADYRCTCDVPLIMSNTATRCQMIIK